MSKKSPGGRAKKPVKRLKKESGQLKRVREVLRESEEKCRAILQNIEELYLWIERGLINP